MGNITKNLQNRETLNNIIQKAFYGTKTIVTCKELPEGFCNAAYEIALSDGKTVILKISPDKAVRLMSCEVEMMQTEVKAMQLVKEKQAVGVAEVFYYDNSRELCSGEYFLMEKLEGQPCVAAKQEMKPEEQAAIDFEIGRNLRKLHDIKGQKFGHFCEKELQFDTWYDAFYSMISRMIADGISENIQIGVPYDVLLKTLESDKSYFDEVKEPTMIHFDSWEGNIFVNKGEITGFIDWERALWADGLMEDRFRHHSVNDNFLKGYGKESLTESEQVRSLWYDVYLYLIMMFEVTFRQYETDDQYKWVRGLFEEVWNKIVERT